MSGENIKIKSGDGKEFPGFLCRPESGSGPGLLLIQEIFGVNDHIRDVADLYAREGFVVLAPDLFWRIEQGIQLGYSDKDMAKGMELYQKLDFGLGVSDLAHVATILRQMPGVNGKVGAVGFCMGGNFAYRLAAHGRVDAAVSYYGGGIDQILDQAKGITSPLIMHFGEKDSHIPQAAVEKIRKAVEGNPLVSIYVYRGADHGFNCDQRGSYDRKSAMLAFARSTAFLHKHLG
ncbi:MAG: carboxymethylenebutenolidase [Candidatus Melainabacteria bacterium]|nr:MAG: carboxymethylenebutenolidase [Candidatus Melainabacteria bacterium]